MTTTDDRRTAPAATLLPCDGVLFDCDGVLVDAEAVILDSWSRWAGEVGLDPATVLPTIHGRRSQDTVAQFVRPEDREQALALIDAIEIEDAARATPIPGALELLDAIPEGRWAIFTSGSHELATARLTAAGVPIPRVIVTGDRVTHGKPHPEGYVTAAARLGVPTGDCIVVEDAAPGIRAARAAGVRSVLGVGHHDTGDERPDTTVPDLRGVRWAGTGLEVSHAVAR